MGQVINNIIKKIPIAFTQKQRYDKQTKQVISKVCERNSNCIDVGSRKGEVLDIMLKYAPNGMHYAFEPIPSMAKALREKFKGDSHCKVYDYALSNNTGTATFSYVVPNPSHSGLIKRKYDRPNEEGTQTEVKIELLDNVIPADFVPALIKIDVEGGELQVLEGAIKTIATHKPTIIFEHSLGGSDFYGSTPDKVFALLHSCGLRISTMQRWLANRPCLTENEFKEYYHKQKDYYFIAYP